MVAPEYSHSRETVVEPGAVVLYRRIDTVISTHPNVVVDIRIYRVRPPEMEVLLQSYKRTHDLF